MGSSGTCGGGEMDGEGGQGVDPPPNPERDGGAQGAGKDLGGGGGQDGG